MDAQTSASLPGWLHSLATQFAGACTDVLEKKMTIEYGYIRTDFTTAWPKSDETSTRAVAEFHGYEFVTRVAGEEEDVNA